MVMQVLDSKDQNEAVTTGVIPVPKEVAEDNARLRGEKLPEETKPVETKPNGEKPETDADDVEGDDGLTPRQKRELTKKMQTSIGKKHRQLKEAEEFAAAQYNEKRLAEQRIAEAEAEIQRLRTGNKQPTQPVNDGTDRPQPQNFTSQEEYEKAVIDWRVNEILKDRDRDAQKKAAEEASKAVADRAMAQLEHAREVVPDFAEVVEAAEVPVPPHIGVAMMESDLFAELGYYFAKNPQELERISALPQSKGLIALGKIEAIIKPFEKSKTNGSKKPSQNGSSPSTETGASQTSPSKPRAAAPITPLSSTSTPQVDTVDGKSVRQVISSWTREKNVDLLRRKRH
jgi:hypothetical protein